MMTDILSCQHDLKEQNSATLSGAGGKQKQKQTKKRNLNALTMN